MAGSDRWGRGQGNGTPLCSLCRLLPYFMPPPAVPPAGDVVVNGHEVDLPFAGTDLTIRRASASFLLLQAFGAHVLWGLEFPAAYITLQPAFAHKVRPWGPFPHLPRSWHGPWGGSGRGHGWGPLPGGAGLWPSPLPDPRLDSRRCVGCAARTTGTSRMSSQHQPGMWRPARLPSPTSSGCRVSAPCPAPPPSTPAAPTPSTAPSPRPPVPCCMALPSRYAPGLGTRGRGDGGCCRARWSQRALSGAGCAHVCVSTHVHSVCSHVRARVLCACVCKCMSAHTYVLRAHLCLHACLCECALVCVCFVCSGMCTCMSA